MRVECEIEEVVLQSEEGREPCYDYFHMVGAETMGQCERCLQWEKDTEAADEHRVVRDIERGGCGY